MRICTRVLFGQFSNAIQQHIFHQPVFVSLPFHIWILDAYAATSIWPPRPHHDHFLLEIYNPGPFYCASCKLDCFLSLLLAHNFCPLFVGCFAFFFVLAFCSSIFLMCPSFCLLARSHHDESRLHFLRVAFYIFSFLRFSVPFAFVQNTIIKFQHLWRRRKINTSRKYLFIISSLSSFPNLLSRVFLLCLFSLIFVVNNYRRQKFARLLSGAWFAPPQ